MKKKLKKKNSLNKIKGITTTLNHTSTLCNAVNAIIMKLKPSTPQRKAFLCIFYN